MRLTAQVLRITLEAMEPILLDAYPGSSLRGALYEALLRRFCMNPEAKTCTECPLNATCPVAALVAPLRDENPRGRDIPRPFVLAPSLSHMNAMAPSANTAFLALTPGQPYSFDLCLIGHAATLFPYIAMSMSTVEVIGIGRRQNGKRGRPQVLSIEALDPFSGETQPLYRRGEAKVAAPTLAVTPERIAERAASLSTERLTLRFLSPTRLIAEGQLMRRPDPRTLVLRLLERLDALEREYGETETVPYSRNGGACANIDETQGEASTAEAIDAVRVAAWQRCMQLAEIASRVEVVDDTTRWVDVASYSQRQGRATPIGGFVGSVTYGGDIAALRELLVWGEVLHIGKNAVKGDGLYRIDA